MKIRIFIVFLLLAFVLKSYSQPFNITATIPYNGSCASGQYQIFRSSSINNITLNNLRKPLIFVEPYDANNKNDIATIKGILYSNNSNNLGSQINNLGYDIIILNFNDGGDYIQKNAFLLVELIKKINAQKPNSEQLVVMGFSMGGLVARYALTYMEQHTSTTGAHQTRLYISYDAPHKGAHIPIGLQALALNFNHNIYLNASPVLAAAINQFTRPAGQQMLKYRITSPTQAAGEIQPSSTYTAFMEELNTLNDCRGFPSNCRNVAFSLGSWNAVGQRSNLDLDNNGVKDLQHTGVPMLYINFSKGAGHSGWIFNSNTCQIVSAIGFQTSLSSAYSENYPYFNQRSSYANLGSNKYATYWYVNAGGPFTILFPQGSWSRFWYYRNYTPEDIAPGSFLPMYSDIANGFGSIADCCFAVSNNSTFVSTVSALAFNTEDLFYNISADPNRLNKTPFDAIYGITGENTSHESNQASNVSIVNSLIDEISHNYGFTHNGNVNFVNQTVNTNTTVTSNCNINVQNVTVTNNKKLILDAENETTINGSFEVQLGSELEIK